MLLGAIQIIRNTLGGGGYGKVSPNDTRRGGGLAKVSRDIFSKNLNYIQVFWTTFLGKLKCHVTWGRVGSKIGQKSVTYYLNGPL